MHVLLISFCLAVAPDRQVTLCCNGVATVLGVMALIIAACHGWSAWNAWATTHSRADQVVSCAKFALSTTALILNLTNLARDISQLRKLLPTANSKTFFPTDSRAYALLCKAYLCSMYSI